MDSGNAQASSSKTHTQKHKSSHRHDADESRAKKHSKHTYGAEKTSKSRDKGKSKSEKASKAGPFEHRRSYMKLAIPPKYATDWLAGVRDQLDGMLMRYVPQMGGVLLAHWEHEFLDDTVKIINECPYGVCEVLFNSILWAPKVGQKLHGTHSLSSPSHISLLFAKTFNISIPLQHIPLDQFEFEHTEEEEDGANPESEDSEDEIDDMITGVEEVGRWRNLKTGKMLGEGGKAVKFTVIGMQVNNYILSLTGSLLSDPENPPPPPTTSAQQRISPSLSPSPDPEPAPKSARIEFNGYEADAPEIEAENPVDEPQIDERYLSARELKKKRKEEKAQKRDERKARKETMVLEQMEELGGETLVDKSGDLGDLEVEAGGKRKHTSDKDGKDKKRKKVSKE